MKRKLIPLVLVAALISLGAYSWLRREPRGLVASGTLEARNIDIGSKVGGRVTRVLASEGDRVEPNQLLITFDDAELEAEVLQARGRLQQAKATFEKMLRGARPEDIEEARAEALPTRGQELAQLQADLERAQADEVNAQRNFQRAEQLANEGVVSKEFRDDAEAKFRMAVAQVRSFEHAISAAEGRLKAAEAVQQRTEKGNRREDIAFARADVLRAEGELREAEARYAEREVRAPAAAHIEVLDLRPGDLVQANAKLAKLLEADQLYVMVYVPHTQIGKVRVGQEAQVTVDSFPGESFPAKVEQIRQRAEFLPRNVQTKEEREHQVIGVKLRVDNRENKLRAGVSAEVKFSATESTQGNR